MKYYFFFVFIVACLFLNNGCGMVMMKAVSTARGGQNDLFVVESIQNLQPYSNIELNPISESDNELLTPELLSYMNDRIFDGLSNSGATLEENGQLRVSGTVLHLTNSFKGKQILVQVKLQDTTTDSVIGVVNVMGKSSGLRGIKSAADAVAKGVTELLATHHFPGISIESRSWL